MHVHVIPGPQRTVSIHHGGHCVVAVVVLRGRVVRLAHSLQDARDHVARVGGGLVADAECWEHLSNEERRSPCVCQAAGEPAPCLQALRSGSQGSPCAA